MRKVMLVVSMAVALAAMTGCKENAGYRAERQAMDGQMRQERKFMDQAIKDHSPDVQRVDLIDSTVVYTHIYDGIIDIKAYTFSGDTCVEVERVYTFPNQMMALRHYRNAKPHDDTDRYTTDPRKVSSGFPSCVDSSSMSHRYAVQEAFCA